MSGSDWRDYCRMMEQDEEASLHAVAEAHQEPEPPSSDVFSPAYLPVLALADIDRAIAENEARSAIRDIPADGIKARVDAMLACKVDRDTEAIRDWERNMSRITGANYRRAR